ncbi:hypothetical protein [Rhizobium sp. FY34]|uniref:hypothetical protein n=1 Tax=Rhizobium sp. FY34 TaxID=2562309 RepID=UPI0010C0460F|nr:hypothetical protein [Rhizobium sp. FY34]
MSEDRRDTSLLIGLHKLAQQNGDGLVPELFDLLTRRPDEIEESDRILRFPIGQTRLPSSQLPQDRAPACSADIIPMRRIGR